MTLRTATGEREAWIGLASTPGVGDVTFEHLLATWGDATTALQAVARLSPARADEELAGLDSACGGGQGWRQPSASRRPIPGGRSGRCWPSAAGS